MWWLCGERTKMKQKNFPAKKLARQLKAQGKDLNSEESKRLIEQARSLRTKKYRSN